MENHQIEEPDPYRDIDETDDPYRDLEPQMRDSLTVAGPFRMGQPGQEKTLFELVDWQGVTVATVYHTDPLRARALALELAASPRMSDTLLLVVEQFGRYLRYAKDAYAESMGIRCEGCGELGQPSRMTFTSSGRSYHLGCATKKLRKEIAEMEKAAESEPDALL
jgi:hypothetical protein